MFINLNKYIQIQNFVIFTNQKIQQEMNSKITDSKKDQRNITNLTKKFNDAQIQDISLLINELEKYIPNYSYFIFTKIYNKLVNLISETPSNHELDIIYDFILNVLSKINPNMPDTDPFSILCSNPEFLIGLFSHTGLDENKEFDHKVLEIIGKYLIVKDPTKIVSLLMSSNEHAFPLMNGLTEKNDVDAAMLFNQLVVCHPQVKQSFIPIVKPILKHFPVHLVVDLMIASDELEKTMTQEEFENWLMEQKEFTLSDVHQLVTFYKDIWNKKLLIHMMLKTNPPDRLAFIKWIRDMPPHNIMNSKEDTEKCSKSILEPEYKFIDVDDISAHKHFNTRELYLFSRLFTLSHSDPNDVPEECIKYLYKLTIDEHEFIASAALQVIAIWVFEKQFVPQKGLVYQIATQIDRQKSESMKNLYMMMIHILSISNSIAKGILYSEQSVHFQQKNLTKVLRSTWIFPNFKAIATNLPMMNGCDQRVAINLVGFIDDYLSK